MLDNWLGQRNKQQINDGDSSHAPFNMNSISSCRTAVSSISLTTGNPRKLRQDAQTLSEFIHKPVWGTRQSNPSQKRINRWQTGQVRESQG